MAIAARLAAGVRVSRVTETYATLARSPWAARARSCTLIRMGGLSPRFRYRYLPRILMTVAVLAVAGVTVYVGARVFENNPGPTEDTRVIDKPAQGAATKKTVPLSKEVMTVASKFVKTAVMRQNLAASWSVTAPTMRQGFTLKQWKTGAIPVVPF